MLIRAVQNHSASLKRGLGMLLVIFILYGTTVEAAHRHGRILPARGNASSVAETEGTSAPLTGKAGCSDCLICQLHHNFSTTLITFRIADPPKQIRVSVAAIVPRDVLSQVTGPTSGRAPPFIS